MWDLVTYSRDGRLRSRGQHDATGRMPSTVGIRRAVCSEIFVGGLLACRLHLVLNGDIPLIPALGQDSRDHVSSVCGVLACCVLAVCMSPCVWFFRNMPQIVNSHPAFLVMTDFCEVGDTTVFGVSVICLGSLTSTPFAFMCASVQWFLLIGGQGIATGGANRSWVNLYYC